MRGITVWGLGVLIGLAVGCGDEDIDDGTNAEDSSSGMAEDPSGTPDDGSTSASSGVDTEPTTTTGGNGLCADANEQCTEFDAASCTCNGCFEECITDRGPSSDCVCSVCQEDEFCMNPENCTDGNGCDPFIEGCQCADCAEHPMCT